jgi:hypothetical protein
MHRILISSLKLFMVMILVVGGVIFSRVHSQEAAVHPGKIEREQKKKQKKAEKEYRRAKKDHVKMQSKETRSMMKRSKKQAKKKTPMKPPGGKKCK